MNPSSFGPGRPAFFLSSSGDSGKPGTTVISTRDPSRAVAAYVQPPGLAGPPLPAMAHAPRAE